MVIPRTSPYILPQLVYTARTALHLPPPVDEALARSAIRARQILLDPIPGNTIFPPGISHADAVSRLRRAFKVAHPSSNRSEDMKALLQLRNGGLIVEIDSEETVNSLKDAVTRKRFLHALEFSVTFKDRSFALVVRYIPVNLLIERQGLLRLIEGENHLDDNSLISMR